MSKDSGANYKEVLRRESAIPRDSFKAIEQSQQCFVFSPEEFSRRFPVPSDGIKTGEGVSCHAEWNPTKKLLNKETGDYENEFPYVIKKRAPTGTSVQIATEAYAIRMTGHGVAITTDVWRDPVLAVPIAEGSSLDRVVSGIKENKQKYPGLLLKIKEQISRNIGELNKRGIIFRELLGEEGNDVRNVLSKAPFNITAGVGEPRVNFYDYSSCVITPPKGYLEDIIIYAGLLQHNNLSQANLPDKYTSSFQRILKHEGHNNRDIPSSLDFLNGQFLTMDRQLISYDPKTGNKSEATFNVTQLESFGSPISIERSELLPRATDWLQKQSREKQNLLDDQNRQVEKLFSAMDAVLK